MLSILIVGQAGLEVVVPLLSRVVGISHATDVELSGLSLRHSEISCPSAARNRSEILTFIWREI